MSKKILVVVLSVVFLAGCAGSVPKLGITDGQLTPCPITPNCVNTQATTRSDYADPFYFTGTQAKAKVRLLKVLEEFARARITEDHEDYIRVEFTSAIFRFVDDVEFYFPAKGSAIVIIQIRSASRLGLSDLGVNKRRIEQIRDKFTAN
ncbi:MAG: hypothetical protein ACJA0G_000091 [Kangiellaceae bacterium]|jgi:uncharacterized protein (DUF1499 family)